jgi:hypothetical protein
MTRKAQLALHDERLLFSFVPGIRDQEYIVGSCVSTRYTCTYMENMKTPLPSRLGLKRHLVINDNHVASPTLPTYRHTLTSQ